MATSVTFFQGFGMSIVGPTLPDLETQTHSTTDQMSYMVTAKSAAIFPGTFLGESNAGYKPKVVRLNAAKHHFV